VLPLLVDFGRHDLPWFGETHLFLPTYGALFALAALVAWSWFLRRGRALGVADDRLFNISFYSLLGGIVGAKLALVALDWRTYLADPAALAGVLRSAGVLMGGVIGGAVVFVLYARRQGLPLHALGDAVAAPLALGQAIGRLGCFAAGCCWGRSCDPRHPLAVTFRNPVAHEQTGVPLGVPLVPVQLIQLASDLLLALLLAALWRRRLEPPGTVFWLYVVLYGLTRGTIEFWRGDVQRGLHFGGTLSTSQSIAIVAVALGAVMLVSGVVRRRRA